MTGALNYIELAKNLNVASQTLKKSWRHLPHFFVGSGTNLKSARFDLQDVLSYLKDRDYDRHQIQDQRGAQVQGQICTSGQANHKGGVQTSERRQRLDCRRTSKAGQGNPDKWGLFRFS